MPREIRIRVEGGKSLEETTEWLAMASSGVLDQFFPTQWKPAMRLLVQQLRQALAEDEERSKQVRKRS